MYPPVIRASSGATNEFSRGHLVAGRRKLLQEQTPGGRARWEAVEVAVSHLPVEEGSSVLWRAKDVTYFL